MQSMSFSRSKMNQNVIFWMQTYFQKGTCRKSVNSKKCIVVFQSKIWRVVKTFYKNLTRCTFFYSKIGHVLTFLLQICFSDRLFRFSLINYQSSTSIKKNLVGKWRWLVVKRIFTNVWHVFVSRLVLSFWLLRSLWQWGSWWVWWLYHSHYQSIYTNLFRISKND